MYSQAAADAIAAARAKFAAKFAAFKPGATPAPSAASTSPLTAAGASTSQASATPPPEVKNEAPAPPTGSHAAAIAEARKKIEAMKARAARSANPYLVSQFLFLNLYYRAETFQSHRLLSNQVERQLMSERDRLGRHLVFTLC